uniref:Uncharacterized protein n=1 Tax=Rhizophora mucronata TaxID=61149 RepID=A0A2P2PHV5_RHIMU
MAARPKLHKNWLMEVQMQFYMLP